MPSKKAIVLCTSNGELYLKKQLESLFAQTDSEFDLYINDDGSTDGTLQIIKFFQEKYPLHDISLTTINYGNSNKNFIETLKKISDSYDYYFFCDQDDIWMKDKVARSTIVLKKISNIPSLFCSRTILIDHNDIEIGKSPLFRKYPSLNNAVVQSIAGGNTMCFNKATKKLLNNVKTEQIPAHDWITYIIVTAHNGEVIYSSDSLVYYRWHNKNQIGPNQSFLAKIKRLKLLFGGEFRKWVKSNNKILKGYNLPINSSKFVELYVKKIHNGTAFERIKYFFKLKLYRQTNVSTFLLFLAILVKKM